MRTFFIILFILVALNFKRQGEAPEFAKDGIQVQSTSTSISSQPNHLNWDAEPLRGDLLGLEIKEYNKHFPTVDDRTRYGIRDKTKAKLLHVFNLKGTFKQTLKN